MKQEHASRHHFFFLPRKTHEPVAANQTGLSPGADTSAIHRCVFSACTTQGCVNRCGILRSLSTIGVPQDTAAKQGWASLLSKVPKPLSPSTVSSTGLPKLFLSHYSSSLHIPILFLLTGRSYILKHFNHSWDPRIIMIRCGSLGITCIIRQGHPKLIFQTQVSISHPGCPSRSVPHNPLAQTISQYESRTFLEYVSPKDKCKYLIVFSVKPLDHPRQSQCYL